MSIPSRPSLRAVASAAGVALGTASRVLSGHKSASPEAKRRVLAAAERLGYSLPPISRSLAARRGRKAAHAHLRIAWLSGCHAFPSEAGAWRRASSRAMPAIHARGYTLEPVRVSPSLDLHQRLPRLAEDGITAILIGDGRWPVENALNADWSPFTVVSMTRTVNLPRFHRMRRALIESIHTCLHRMLASGYRRAAVALTTHPERRQEDFAHAASLLPIQREFPRRIAEVREFPADRVPDPAAFGRWLRRTRADVLLASSEGFLPLLKQAGFRVPRDIGFACLDAEEGGRTSGTCGLHSQWIDLSVELLDRLFRAGVRGVPSFAYDVMLPSHWQNGRTLSARNSNENVPTEDADMDWEAARRYWRNIR